MPKMPSYKPGKNAIEWWVHFAFCVPGVVVVVRHTASVAPQLALRACRHAVTFTAGAHQLHAPHWPLADRNKRRCRTRRPQALMQWEDYHGLGGNANKPYSRTTALPVLPAFAANLFALPLLFRVHWTEEGERVKDVKKRNGSMLRRLFDKRMWLIAICAIVGEIANQTSIVLAGSLTFTVVYSSVTIWTAVFGIPLLHKSPNRVQWVALVLIVLGLLSSAASHTANEDKALLPHANVTAHKAAAEAAEAAAKAGAADYAIGAAAGLVGSMSYALMYVLTEKTQKAADAPPPEALCVFVGMVGTAVLVAYIAVWDGPSWCGSDGNHHAALTLGVIFSHGTKPTMTICQDRLGTKT